MTLSVGVQQLDHGKDLPLPSYGTPGSAGLDLYAAILENKILSPFERYLVATGIAMSLPMGFEGQIRPRSGLALKHGVTVLNTPGTIDADYRGEVQVILINLSQEIFTLERGMRIAQLVIAPYTSIDWCLNTKLEETERNRGSFGSTGY